VDIENSTALTNPAKASLRHVMYDLLEGALLAGGIAEGQRDPLVDRGDGVLALVHSVLAGAKVRLLNPVIPTLHRLLVEHNGQHPDLRFRLRAVVHAGDVHQDPQGCFGEALDITFRLLDSPRLKKALKERPDAPMVLVVSDEIYHTVVKHDYPGIDKAEFTSLGHVRTGRDHHRGWLQIPTL
jgi:hypothetical protein